MRPSLLMPLLVISFSVARVGAADPSNAVLSLDALSFVANAFDNGEQIPISGIPVRLESGWGDSWSLFIEPADVNLPPVKFKNGEQVKWTLMERASGSVTFAHGMADVTLSARFLAKSLDSPRQTVHHLTFTTKTTKALRGSLEVAREGVSLDRRSGYVQLVASATDPPKSNHGIPFFVVLSGRFTSGPPGFLGR